MNGLDLDAIERDARTELAAAGGYEPWDQEAKMGKPPWKQNRAALLWEAAHGHDPRLKCYPEFGCQVEHVPYVRTILTLVEALRAAP